MDQRFGVGLREELDAVSFELHSKFRRVLDDAVMHQRDGSRNVWVGVDIVWFAVGRPAGVPDRWMTAQLLRKCRFELAQLSFFLDDLEFALRSDERNAGRVVAAVFNALKTLKEDWETVLGTDISDDAAHGVLAFEVKEFVWCTASAVHNSSELAFGEVRWRNNPRNQFAADARPDCGVLVACCLKLPVSSLDELFDCFLVMSDNFGNQPAEYRAGKLRGALEQVEKFLQVGLAGSAVVRHAAPSKPEQHHQGNFLPVFGHNLPVFTRSPHPC